MKDVPCKKCILLAVCISKKYETAVLRAEECSILHDFIYGAKDERSYQDKVLLTREVFNLECITRQSISTESWENDQRKKRKT